jgi:PKHD-type hydroxylase
MSRSIERFVPALEDIVVWSGGFTSQECDEVIQTGELFEFMKAGIGEAVGDDAVDEEYRKTNITWIQPEEEHKWIFERIHEITAKVNFDKFQLDLRRFDAYQYSKYEVGSFYKWHRDISNVPTPNGLYRKLSVVLMLSEPEEYAGGDLVLCTSGSFEDTKRIKLNKGDIVFFYSTTPHTVEPVTEGSRLTLVTWCLGEKFK